MLQKSYNCQLCLLFLTLIIANMNPLPKPSALATHWSMNPNIVYLNHGSFGGTPTYVTNSQRALQTEMEYEAIEYFIDKLPTYLNTSKLALANFVGTDANNIVYTQNTTTGINCILSSMPSQVGDEWLTTNQSYGACVHALKQYAYQKGCTVVTAQIPYPVQNDVEIVAAFEAAITPKTKVALVDYITSATALILPIKKIITLLQSKGIKVVVDAAHAPGMVNFSIDELQPNYFVANCHKWICSPKGSAFMYVAPQHQDDVKPLVISHYNDTAEGTAAHWSNQFMWDGTHDYSTYITVKTALEYMPTLIEGGWAAIKNHNHNLVLTAAHTIANALQVQLPTTDAMVGSIVNIPMPNGKKPKHSFHSNTELKNILFEKYKIEVPIFMYPHAPQQWLRLSAQLYNSMEQYNYLLACLQQEFG